MIEKVVLYTQQKKNLIAISGDTEAHLRPSAYHMPGGDSPGPSQREGDPIKEIIQRSYMPQLRPSTVINQYINI